METSILHICKRPAWIQAQNQGEYRAASLAEEGFIHCSTIHQVVKTANLLFQGQGDLVLLYINPEKVSAEIRYENTEGGDELFPHIYGALNLDAVDKVLDLQADAQGYFELPAE